MIRDTSLYSYFERIKKKKKKSSQFSLLQSEFIYPFVKEVNLNFPFGLEGSINPVET